MTNAELREMTAKRNRLADKVGPLAAELAASNDRNRALTAERDNLSLSFCNAVTRCEGAEATLSERTFERDNAVQTAQEMAQAVVDLTAERDALQDRLTKAYAKKVELEEDAAQHRRERNAALARVAELEEALHQCIGSLKAFGAADGYASESARALTAMCEGPLDAMVERACIAYADAPLNASDEEAMSAALRAALRGSPE